VSITVDAPVEKLTLRELTIAAFLFLSVDQIDTNIKISTASIDDLPFYSLYFHCPTKASRLSFTSVRSSKSPRGL